MAFYATSQHLFWEFDFRRIVLGQPKTSWSFVSNTLKVLNFAGIKFRDFAIFSLNREIKYQREMFQVYNREIKYLRNLISGGF